MTFAALTGVSRRKNVAVHNKKIYLFQAFPKPCGRLHLPTPKAIPGNLCRQMLHRVSLSGRGWRACFCPIFKIWHVYPCTSNYIGQSEGTTYDWRRRRCQRTTMAKENTRYQRVPTCRDGFARNFFLKMSYVDHVTECLDCSTIVVFILSVKIGAKYASNIFRNLVPEPAAYRRSDFWR